MHFFGNSGMASLDTEFIAKLVALNSNLILGKLIYKAREPKRYLAPAGLSLAALPFAVLAIAMINQKSAQAAQPKDWNFGKCYSDVMQKHPSSQHERVISWCNFMMKMGPQFNYAKATGDYCVKEEAAQLEAREEEVTTRRVVDRFGLPALDPKRYGTPSMSSDGSMEFYHDFNSLRLLKNKGEYGRYIAWDYILRWMAEPIAATPGYQMQTSGGSTQCYGSAYGLYGGAYGSSNCYTTPPSTVYIPGNAGSQGGARQRTLTVVLDCIDRTAQYDKKGPWKPFTDEKFADKICTARTDPAVPRGEEI